MLSSSVDMWLALKKTGGDKKKSTDQVSTDEWTILRKKYPEKKLANEQKRLIKKEPTLVQKSATEQKSTPDQKRELDLASSTAQKTIGQISTSEQKPELHQASSAAQKTIEQKSTPEQKPEANQTSSIPQKSIEQKTTSDQKPAEELKSSLEQKSTADDTASSEHESTSLNEELFLKSSLIDDAPTKALIKLAQEMRQRNCDPDAFADARDGYAKIICSFMLTYGGYLRGIEPALLQQFLTIMISTMQKEEIFPSNDPLILACQAALKSLEGKIPGDSLRVKSKEIKSLPDLKAYEKAILPIKEVMKKYDSEKQFEHSALKFTFEHFAAKDLIQPAFSVYNSLLRKPSISKDHQVLKALKQALCLHPNNERNTVLHLSILGGWPGPLQPNLVSLCVTLMSSELKLNNTNAEGNTALHLALKEIDSIRRNRGPWSMETFTLYTAIKFVLQQPGIDISVKDREGNSVLDYILRYEDLTFFALKFGKIEPSVAVKNQSLLCHAIKNEWHAVFNYLVTNGQLDLNKQGYEFVCHLIQLTKAEYSNELSWVKTLLKNLEFTPLRPNHGINDSLYNTKIIVAMLNNKNIAMLRMFLTHPNSMAFLNDEKEYKRFEALAACHDRALKKETALYDTKSGQASKAFKCSKQLFNAYQEIKNNNFDSARKQFDEVFGKDATWDYYFENVTQSLLAGGLDLDKSQATELIKIINYKIGSSSCSSEIAHNLKLLNEGHNKLIEPDLLFAKHFVEQEFYCCYSSDRPKREQEIKRINDKIDQLRDDKISPENAMDKLIAIAKQDEFTAWLIRRVYGEKKDLHYKLLVIYIVNYAELKPEFINALRFAIIQIPRDYQMTVSRDTVASSQKLGIFSSTAEAKKEMQSQEDEKVELPRCVKHVNQKFVIQ